MKSKDTFSLVSIITPAYNSQKYIAVTIESVLNQTYEHWEMIIVNDCSNDNTQDIVEDYAKKDPRIHLINNKYNLGAAESRNIAIKAAQGRYIAFLDSDDVWFPKKLATQIEFMQKYKLFLTYSSYFTINESGEYINIRSVPREITYKSMLKSNHIGNLTGIYDADFFGKVMLSRDGHEDYILWLELLKKVPFTKGITKPLAVYKILPNSISSNKFKALKWQWNIYRKHENLSILQSFYYILWYVYYALKKRA